MTCKRGWYLCMLAKTICSWRGGEIQS